MKKSVVFLKGWSNEKADDFELPFSDFLPNHQD
jgi:hypothetical protein